MMGGHAYIQVNVDGEDQCIVAVHPLAQVPDINAAEKFLLGKLLQDGIDEFLNWLDDDPAHFRRVSIDRFIYL